MECHDSASENAWSKGSVLDYWCWVQTPGVNVKSMLHPSFHCFTAVFWLFCAELRMFKDRFIRYKFIQGSYLIYAFCPDSLNSICT